ncbi:MAG: MFS transporter [Chloroflexi bacterium]|nr:MFS transporter [Chloroflexota bacterium]
MKWRYEYRVLAVCCAAFGLYHATRQIVPPAVPLLKDQFDLTYTQASILSSAFDIGYGMTLIVGGFIGDRVKKVPLVVAGLIGLSIMLILTPLANSFWSFAAIRMLTGVAFSTYFTSGLSTLSSYFPVSERGKALGIHMGLGAGSGKLFAPLIAGLILPVLGWHPLFYLLGIPAILTAFVFWRVVKEPKVDMATISRPSTTAIFSNVFGNRSLFVLGLCGALVISGNLSLYPFLPIYLVQEMGADLAYGGFAIAFLNGVSIPFVPIAGTLSDRFGRRAVIFTLSVCSALVLYIFPMLSGGIQVLLGIAVMGAVVGTAFSVILSYVVDTTPSTYRGLALGYSNTITVLGGAIGSTASGYISDLFGVRAIFVFVASLALLAALVVLLVAAPKPAIAAQSELSRS